MAMIRMGRIENLLLEAEDMFSSERQSVIGGFEFLGFSPDLRKHMNSKIEKALDSYKGKELCETTTSLLCDQSSSQIALELVHTVISVMGVKMFYKDFILPDLNATHSENVVMASMLHSLGGAWSHLEPDMIEAVSNQTNSSPFCC